MSPDLAHFIDGALTGLVNAGVLALATRLLLGRYAPTRPGGFGATCLIAGFALGVGRSLCLPRSPAQEPHANGVVLGAAHVLGACWWGWLRQGRG